MTSHTTNVRVARPGGGRLAKSRGARPELHQALDQELAPARRLCEPFERSDEAPRVGGREEVGVEVVVERVLRRDVWVVVVGDQMEVVTLQDVIPSSTDVFDGWYVEAGAVASEAIDGMRGVTLAVGTAALVAAHLPCLVDGRSDARRVVSAIGLHHVRAARLTLKVSVHGVVGSDDEATARFGQIWGDFLVGDTWDGSPTRYVVGVAAGRASR